MQLTPCGCGVTYLVRLNRTLWMRLLPGRRHYFCVRCKAHQLLSRAGLRQLFPTMSPELDRDVTAPAALEEPGFLSRAFADSRVALRRAPARPRRH